MKLCGFSISHAALYVILCLSIIVEVKTESELDQFITSMTSKCADGTIYDSEAGACCRTCPKGQGVALPCMGPGLGNDTVCTSCIDGLTYSSKISHEESCQPCSHCPPNAQAVHRCNVTHNTKCECMDGFWYDSEKRMCSKCFLCQPGFEASRSCAPYQNTHCNPCARGYYSDSYGFSTKCRLCSLCKPGQLVRTACSTIRDTECVDAKALLNGIGSTDSPIVSTVNLFPVYCAIPAFVLVSLIIFVVLKRWRPFWCSRTPPGKSSFVPHGSLQSTTSTLIVKDHHRYPCQSNGRNKRHCDCESTIGPCCVKEMKPMLITPDSSVQCLPNDKLEQLERKLTTVESAERAGWIALAKQLGYCDTRIATFNKDAVISGSSPCKQFLQDWSYDSHNSIQGLLDALDNIGRSDLSSILKKDIDYTCKTNNNNKALICGPVHFV